RLELLIACARDGRGQCLAAHLSAEAFDIEPRDALDLSRTEVRQQIALEHRLVVGARRLAQAHLAVEPPLRKLSEREALPLGRKRVRLHLREPLLQEL